ncbi:MAG: peptidylprolyl isomerase [Candidatus Krumholzibacteria bacterium]|nr:peptidylprolyl isomerase [Candidatus Krumholzibacteria bacterium]
MVVGPSFAKAKSPVVVMETSKGAITIELYPDKAPKTVENFLWYVDNEFYNGLIFHRVMDNFMIQGGGFTKDLVQKQPNPAIENEAHNALTNARGTIAMARTPDVNSATCQFFINLKDNDFLNHKDKTPRNYGYAVFGKVIDGMDVVDEIAKVKVVSKSGYENVPATPVVISKVYQSKKEHAKEADKSSKEKPKKEE